ncbi:MAG: hypothetical protein PHW69_03930 [Elusimicrobiaceae bacterium]|nr:hypothetical protein [Elusimicrobiaceae bacterium]
MKCAVAVLFAATLACACAQGVRTGSGRTLAAPDDGPLSKSAAAVVSSATFMLGRAPGQGEINRFYRALETAQAAVIEKAGGPEHLPEGFSYAVTPAGAVNPFSSVEVDCLLSREAAADFSARFCRQFIELLLPQYPAAGYAKP